MVMLVLIISTLTLPSCWSAVSQHGHIAQIGAIKDIVIGIPKNEVLEVLGSPSIIINNDRISYYYINSIYSHFQLINIKENKRNIIAIHFNKENKVFKILHYDLKDGLIINYLSKKTPSYKKNLNFFEEIFKNINILYQ